MATIVEPAAACSYEQLRNYTQRQAPLPLPADRLPHHTLANIFIYLPLNGVAACMRVCRHWHRCLAFEDSEIWQRLCLKEIPFVALSDPNLLNNAQTCVAKLRAWRCAWNSDDISKNAYIKTNGFTMHRNPIAQSTDGVRAKKGFQSGRHCWEIWWDGPLGTVAVIGLATRHSALQCSGYSALIGSDNQSWGWNLVTNQLYHDSKEIGEYPSNNEKELKNVAEPPEENIGRYQIGERIRCVLDCDNHYMYFESGSTFLGKAFTNLPPVLLYPAICAVYGNTEVTMVYLGAPEDG